MMPQMDLIAELKKRQVKPQVTDGAIDDIITGELHSGIELWSAVCILELGWWINLV